MESRSGSATNRRRAAARMASRALAARLAGSGSAGSWGAGSWGAASGPVGARLAPLGRADSPWSDIRTSMHVVSRVYGAALVARLGRAHRGVEGPAHQS